MGTVDGCGYNSQLKYTICEACRPCHSILSILRPIFRGLRQIRCTFESLRYLNPNIWRFLWTTTTTTIRPTKSTLPLAHVRGVIKPYPIATPLLVSRSQTHTRSGSARLHPCCPEFHLLVAPTWAAQPHPHHCSKWAGLTLPIQCQNDCRLSTEAYSLDRICGCLQRRLARRKRWCRQAEWRPPKYANFTKSRCNPKGLCSAVLCQYTLQSLGLH